nr:hypothetical protein [Prolixibacteraceae bacterium]
MIHKIIYILGTGRTGTTLLGIALNNNPQIFDAGEILKFIKLHGQPHGFSKNSDNYRFWANVYQKTGSKITIDDN